MKYLRALRQRWFGCRKGKHIYIGIPNGTACIVCNWRDV